MRLRLFLDSADPQAWSQWLPSGLFHGITTNPTLLKQAGQPCRLEHLRQLSQQALDLGCRELHLQAWGGDAASYLACGRQLASLALGPIVVKLPVTRAGASAARALIADDIAVTFTACYEVPQVLIAAALGAAYIAPYLGRIGDQGRDGLAELVSMQHSLDGLGSSVRLLVASVRQPADLGRLAAEGLSTFTISPAIAAGLFGSEATATDARRFEADAGFATS
ncbi:MAG: transaldolase family protein [Synechococcaceae cyanobacterium ELA263]